MPGKHAVSCWAPAPGWRRSRASSVTRTCTTGSSRSCWCMAAATSPSSAYGEELVEHDLPENEFIGELVAREAALLSDGDARAVPATAAGSPICWRRGKLTSDLGLPPLGPEHDRVMLCGSPALLADMVATAGARRVPRGQQQPARPVCHREGVRREIGFVPALPRSGLVCRLKRRESSDGGSDRGIVGGDADPAAGGWRGRSRAAGAARAKTMLAKGCDGLVPFGTTGEGTSFSGGGAARGGGGAAEAGIAPGQIALGAGYPSVPDTVALTRGRARAWVCTHVLVLPPYFFRRCAGGGDRGRVRGGHR